MDYPTPSSESLNRVRSFTPPYCPNPECICHQPEVSQKEGSFIRFGLRSIRRPPYISQRFRCLLCHKTFTSSFFSFSYRDRLPDTYKETYLLRIVSSASKRSIAKSLHQTLDTVLRRLTKISQQGTLHWAKDLENLRIAESVAYDGIENFSFSQYDPNNVNHAVGRESLFCYDYNFSPLNRKGRMNESQKRKKKELEETHGKYPPRSIKESSKRIFERLLSRADELILHTDNHCLYRSAIEDLKDKNKITHFVTPAKVARNYRNRLFAINHFDLLTRHYLCDFKRETIAFAKNSLAMIESFNLLAVYKNYMRPKFEKKQKRDPRSNTQSPAMHLGLRIKIESFEEFFHTRMTKHQVKLNEDWQMFFARLDPYSRRRIRSYAGM